MAGTAITGALSTTDTSITVINGLVSFGDIAIGATGSNSTSPFTVQAGSRVYPGKNVNFNLVLTSSNGSVATRTFSLVVGHVNTFDPIGPDSYGYYMYDNTDGGYLPCPVYNWVEISPYEGGAGTRVTFPFSTDDDAVVITPPFNIMYYGQSFPYMMVSINGFVAFDTARYDMQGHHWSNFDNNQMPEAGAPDGLIAPFWDDLKFNDNSGNYGVFRYYDAANHRFIIEWKACYHPQSPGNHPETFQAIFYDPAFYPTPTGDCEILFQYHTVYNDDTDTWDTEAPGLYSTVGIQNPSNNDGLQYTYDNLYHAAAATLQAGRAIKITTITGFQEPPDVAYDPPSFFVSGNVGQMLTDTLNVSNVSGGLLAFTLGEYADNGLLAAHGNSNAETERLAPGPIGYASIPGSKPGDDNQPIYPPVVLNHGGPDVYGNFWIDSDDAGGPVYSWVDISSVGTPVTFSSDDASVGPVNMGISFPFYGNAYNSIYINANGILTFGIGTEAFSNQDTEFGLAQ